MKVTQYDAVSKDGTKIPYFMFTPKGFTANGKNPTLQYGYGGFEISMRPTYSGSTGSAWVERGGVYVLANIRGGGEFGPKWHRAAMKEKHQNAFDDFIAVSEDLIKRKVTSPEHLGIMGGSNGGLLVGACFTQRPELFHAVACQVPLLDMKRYNHMLAGASWMAEYGNPDTDDWNYIQKWSPYQNLDASKTYPKVFFYTNTRDDRVHPGHARKMVAKMTDMNKPVYYYENTEGGHSGGANLNQRAYSSALTYARTSGRCCDRVSGTVLPKRACSLTDRPLFLLVNPLGGRTMAKLLVLVGTTIGGGIGWWIGERIGIMTAFVVSMIGTGVESTPARRHARRLSG
jgi:prolyl oligopeptidase